MDLRDPKPLWNDIRLPRSAKLSVKRRFDVVIIGGGITGLTAAWLLKRAGRSVAVLERERIGAVDTGHTTAHLTMVTDLRLKSLVANFGKSAAKLVWRGGLAAIGTIEKIASELAIDCEFRRVNGYLHASLDQRRDESGELEAEAALARELGFEAEFSPAVPYFEQAGVRYANQAKFHPLKYLAGLAAAIKGDGSAIFEQSEVTEVTAEKGHAIEVKCGSARAMGDYLVIATHVPLMGLTGLVSATLLQTKIYPYSSYVVSGSVEKDLLPEACFWDTSDPYYYLRLDEGEKSDSFIFGGLDHKTGQVEDVQQRFADLRAKLYSRIPEATIDHEWSGQVVETNDGLPYMGETAERQFVATGFAGNGMTFGTLGAMLACDAALARDNPWQSLLSVNRKNIRGGAWDYLTENLTYPYYLLLDTLRPSDAASPKALQPGEGKVLSLDGERVACSRDEQGQLHSVSAVCTHMGCLVQWNNAERTWDCPCHGSRFHPTGEVLAGPAETPLAAVEVKQPRKPAAKQRKPKPDTDRGTARAQQSSSAQNPSPRPASKTR